jgi:hypothetical protein
VPNQLNFPDQLPQKLIIERPSRLARVDTKQFQTGVKQVVFGITERDVVELWAYFPDGRLAGHVTLPVYDTAIRLSTAMDNTGAYEFLNIDFGEVVRRMSLEQGRYGLVVNIFRNEVGSELGEKLTVEAISEDRTEVRLVAARPTDNIMRELYEFTVPSVPKIVAQGLVDQTFGQSLDALPDEQLDSDKVLRDVDIFINGTSARLDYADAEFAYELMTTAVLDRAYPIVLNKMAADRQNLNIQEADLERYMSEAIQEVVRDMRDRGEIDNRFEVT